ncbi:MAG: hypothetical protein NTY53_24795 [Kiritimatiellaeota bacterium]|nr:hypothetical protein [Kiritimatiellota bacterium]
MAFKRKKPWAVALIYVGISLGLEAALIVIGGLRVPRDNAILAPVVLTLPPLLTAWLGGYRWPGELMVMALALAVLTLVLTLLFGNLTGVSTGLLEPLLVRSLAGFLTGLLVNRLMVRAKA